MAEQLTAAALVARLLARDAALRTIVAVAGPPGAGKSTFADHLVERLNAGGGAAAVFPMDGYHYDDIVLNARGHRPRKGAPHTFDVDGFAHTLARLRADDGRPVAVPVFDRSIEIARAGARIVEPSTRIVVAEGNYLLLDDPAWQPLADAFDLTVMLTLPDAEIERRLAERWRALAGDDFVAKMEGNDLPNARLVVARSRPADVEIRSDLPFG